MAGLAQVGAALFALVGFILLSRGLLMSKRHYRRRPRHLASGAACLAGAAVLLWIGSGAALA